MGSSVVGLVVGLVVASSQVWHAATHVPCGVPSTSHVCTHSGSVWHLPVLPPHETARAASAAAKKLASVRMIVETSYTEVTASHAAAARKLSLLVVVLYTSNPDAGVPMASR